MNILVINGHKYYSYAEGKLNKTLFDEIIKILSPSNEIKTTIVEEGYDVSEEIDKFKWANLIIFQTPINWFSAPWLLKKYFDEIYAHGIFYTGSQEYGRGGLFRDKMYMYSLTWNSPCTAFEETGGFFDGRSIDDIIIALHKMQEFCAMKKLETFSVNDVVHNPNIPLYLECLNEHLHKNIIDKSF